MGIDFIAKGYTITGEKVATKFVKIKTLANYIMINDFYLSNHYHPGWGNGYVVLHPDHPLYLVEDIPIYVHGGVTYDEYITESTVSNTYVKKGRMLGFDTAHQGDCLENWAKDDVEFELKRFVFELENYIKGDDSYE